MHILSSVTDYCPTLNQLKGENYHRKDFIISIYESYVVELEVELVTPGCACGLAAYSAREPASPYQVLCKSTLHN